MWLWGLLLLSLFPSCQDRPTLLPQSGGQLYEVLLVGDRAGLVEGALAKDVEGLPQSEPQFDVTTIDSSRFGQTLRYTRNIVFVTIDPTAYTKPAIRYERNVWAQPQIVAYVGAPSVKALRRSMPTIAPTLLRLLNRSELNKSLTVLRHKRNTKAEKEVEQMFGIRMWVPADMVASKRGKDFIWLSNNSATTMTNLVVYRDWAPRQAPDGKLHYYGDKTIGHIAAARDSMLGANIKGETDSMRMATVHETVAVRRGATEIYYGLWEMKGDDMGGPFVSRIIPMGRHGLANCPNTVAEGFVFAPGRKKRNAIRQLEAVLCSAKAQ